MAAATQELERFVRESLARGMPRQAIEEALTGAGWPADQSRSALDAYADVAFPVPVPKPRPYLSAREAFLYLVLFTTLYLWAWNLANLLFDLIDHAFPDPADQRYRLINPAQSIRWSISSVIIAFPVFLYVAHYVGREWARGPIKRLSAVRRWLTYLTLFIAATVLIIDMIALVSNVLSGEVTVRFCLKVLVAALIAGAIFGYYLFDLRGEEREELIRPSHAGSVGRWLAVAVSLVVSATIVTSVIVTGTPAEQREVNLDARRVRDLEKIVEAIDLHVKQANALPASLVALASAPGVRLAIADPVTAKPYEFQPIDAITYRLCATFTTDTAKTPAPADYSYGYEFSEWDHGVGDRCFKRTAKK